MTVAPYTFAEACERIALASEAQADAEDLLRRTSADAADAEEAYRVALAQMIVHMHDQGVAWTVCQDLARGNIEVASLRKLRDIAAGSRDAAAQVGWRLTADRKDLTQMIAWSMRRDLAEDPPQPAWSTAA